MSSVGQLLHELPDLFCELYDGFDEAAFRSGIEDWSADEGLRSTSVTLCSQACAGTLTAGSVDVRLRNSQQPDATRYAILRALDWAFSKVNPCVPTSAGAPPAMTRLAVHAATYFRLDSGQQGGALIPRLTEPPGAGQVPDALREAFTSVLRVSDEDHGPCEPDVMPPSAQLSPRELRGGLRVGCVPLIADQDEVKFEVIERNDLRFYRITPRDLRRTRQRIGQVLDRLIASGARIGVAPELTLSAALLEEWRSALRARRRQMGRLQWLLVGSGDIERPEGSTRAANKAVLLDARTGHELLGQRKLYPFNFSTDELKRWQLTDLLGHEPIDEDLEPGEKVIVAEGGGVRLAVLVCEDLSRVLDLAPALRSFGVSLMLVPVFSRPTKDRRWERAAADVHVRSTGSTLVIANSRVMHDVLQVDEGTGLIVRPSASNALVLRSGSADEVHCVDLLADGTAKHV